MSSSRRMILKVSIPDAGIRSESSKVVYYSTVVRCVLANGTMTAWTILARYNEFLDLYKAISGKTKQLSDFPFPPKRIINSSKIVQERKEKFAEFLQIAVKLNPMPIELFIFFELDTNTSITRVQYYSGIGDDGDSRSISADDSAAHRLDLFSEDDKKAFEGTALGEGAVRHRLNSNPEPMRTKAQKDKGIVAEGSVKRPSGTKSNSYVNRAASFRQKKKEAREATPEDFEYSPKWRLNAILLVVVTAFSVILRCYEIYSWCRRELSYVIIQKGIITGLATYSRTFTYTGEILLGTFLVWLFIHRIIGYALTWYLQTYLKNQETEAFSITCRWASLRLGLDLNEIILYDVTWENTSGYVKTPYFIHLEYAIIKFKLTSILHSIWTGNDWHIIALELDEFSVHMEKDLKGELNLWAAIGAVADSSNGKAVKSSAISSVIKAIESTQDAAGGFADTLMKYNPVTLLITTLKSMASDESKKDKKLNVNVNAESDEVEVVYPPGWGIPIRFSLQRLTVRKLKLYAQDYLNASHSDLFSGQAILIKILEMKYKTLRDNSIPLPTNKTNELKKNRRKSTKLSFTSPLGSPSATEHKELGHGPSYKHLNDIQEEEDEYDEWMGLVDKGEFKLINDGVYLDTLTWKLVGKLVTELLLSNSGKLLGILVAAAANNAAASAANALSSTMETAFNYNPISLAKSGYGSMKRLQRSNENVVPRKIAADLQCFGIGGTEVRIIGGRNIMYMNELMDSCFCVISYCNQPSGIQDKSSKYKTDVRNCVGDDHENLITWDEQIEMGQFYTLETMLHIRIFEYKIARKDLLIGEVDIPLIKIISQLSVPPEDVEGEMPRERELHPGVVNVVGKEVVDWYVAENKNLLENTGGELEIGIEFVPIFIKKS